MGPSIFAWDRGINTIVDNNKIFEADRRAMTEFTLSGLSVNCCNYAAHFIYTYFSFTCYRVLFCCSYRLTANDENSNFPGLGFCAWCNFAAVVLNDYRLPMIDASTATAVT